MKRFILQNLQEWQQEAEPHPLLLRGARQIGKSYIVKQFAKESFKNFLEINFDKEENMKQCFKSLDPKNILSQISTLKNIDVEPGKTLIFLDEIQECPQAIHALRYFYEDMPGLHVIAAGSLLEFVLNSADFKMPVGRIHNRFMSPMTFAEFLLAQGKAKLIDFLKTIEIGKEIPITIHEALLEEFRKYMLVGGMPEAIKKFLETNNYQRAFEIQEAIVSIYKRDFGKYSNEAKHKYLRKVFEGVPKNLATKFMYSNIDPDSQSRDLKNALELLSYAGIVNIIKRNSSAKLPLEVGASEKHFKTSFLDVGLAQNILGTDAESVFSQDLHSKALGSLAEQIVGQELLAYGEFYKEKRLYHWAKEDYGSTAEIDYLYPCHGHVIPLEVKSGTRGKLKSLFEFVKKFKPPLAVKISQDQFYYKKEESFLSLPLYAVSELKRLCESQI